MMINYECTSNSISYHIRAAENALNRYKEVKDSPFSVKKNIYPFDKIGTYIKNTLKGLKKLDTLDTSIKIKDNEYFISYKMIRSLYAIERVGFHLLGYVPNEKNQFNYGFQISVQLLKKTKHGNVLLWEADKVEFTPDDYEEYNPFNRNWYGSEPTKKKDKKAYDEMIQRLYLFR